MCFSVDVQNTTSVKPHLCDLTRWCFSAVRRARRSLARRGLLATIGCQCLSTTIVVTLLTFLYDDDCCCYYYYCNCGPLHYHADITTKLRLQARSRQVDLLHHPPSDVLTQPASQADTIAIPHRSGSKSASSRVLTAIPPRNILSGS